MKARLNPAYSIVKRLGGEAVVAKITHRAITAPYRWQKPVSEGGTGGLIPQRLHRPLLEYALEKGKELSPADFIASPSPAAVEAAGNEEPIPAADRVTPAYGEAAE
jgi:hypothetical protein